MNRDFQPVKFRFSGWNIPMKSGGLKSKIFPPLNRKPERRITMWNIPMKSGREPTTLIIEPNIHAKIKIIAVEHLPNGGGVNEQTTR